MKNKLAHYYPITVVGGGIVGKIAALGLGKTRSSIYLVVPMLTCFVFIYHVPGTHVHAFNH